jgi:hypothetical protein
MKLYKATYDITWLNEVRPREYSIYILALDFQTATKLAETNSKISDVLTIAGDPASSLSRVELIASDIVQE